MQKELKALGMICGVGSMLIGAKQQGFGIIGNIEWRKYYHTGTFEQNFPGSWMINTLKDLSPEQLVQCQDLDLIIGHTECGNFSNMRADKMKAIDLGNKGDIPEFVEAVQLLKPKFFAMDNLPKSLIVADYNYYAEQLPEYDIHFEWISNWGYGNIQKNRKRLFVIGSKKELGFYFIPNEVDHNTSTLDRLNEISSDAENNELLDLDEIYNGWTRYNFDINFIAEPVDRNRITLREFQDFIREMPVGLFPYYNRAGEQKIKIGFAKVNPERFAWTLSGGGACYDNHFRSDTLFPYTIRERAKIQGAPDDFVFLPKGITKTNREYSSLIKQTGKFMPVQFCTFLSAQIKSFLDGTRQDSDYNQKRTINNNEFIDQNKHGYCMENGYSNQDKVCEFCGARKYCDKMGLPDFNPITAEEDFSEESNEITE